MLVRMWKTKVEAVEEWLSNAENLLVAPLLLDDHCQDLPGQNDDVDDTFDLLAIHHILQATDGP